MHLRIAIVVGWYYDSRRIKKTHYLGIEIMNIYRVKLKCLNPAVTYKVYYGAAYNSENAGLLAMQKAVKEGHKCFKLHHVRKIGRFDFITFGLSIFAKKYDVLLDGLN